MLEELYWVIAAGVNWYDRRAVLATSEVIPSRAVRALEGEGIGLSHLEVVTRGAIVAPASQ
jgi:hypothetical protein